MVLVVVVVVVVVVIELQKTLQLNNGAIIIQGIDLLIFVVIPRNVVFKTQEIEELQQLDSHHQHHVIYLTDRHWKNTKWPKQ